MLFHILCLQNSSRNQYLSVLITNIAIFSHGSVTGWISPALLILKSDATPIRSGPLTPSQVAWLASISCLGGVAGVFVFGQIITRFGTRIALILMTVPNIIWWVLVAFGETYPILLVARVISGMAAGAVFRVHPHFVADMAQKEIRGILSTISALVYNFGMLIGFVLGGYLPYKLVPLYSIIFPISNVILVSIFIHEPPQFFISKGEDENAYKSLLFYRSVRSDKYVPQSVQDEFTDLKQAQANLKQQTKATWADFCTKEARFALIMVVFLAWLFQFSGAFALTQFTAPIFVESGASLSPSNAAIVVAVLQILGNIVSFSLVDRAGRKVLLLISCFGTSIALAALGAYSYVDSLGFDITTYNWIPVVTFSAGYFLLSIGITTTPFTILAEILSTTAIKNAGLTIANIVNPALGFLLLVVFPFLMEEIGVYGIMWMFSASCLLGFVVSLVFLPETKGKNLVKY